MINKKKLIKNKLKILLFDLASFKIKASIKKTIYR